MNSKNAMTLLLLVAGAALVVVLGAMLSLDLVKLADPYSSPKKTKDDKTDTVKYGKPPRLFTKIEGTDAVIVEVDDQGNTIRTVYTSSLIDPIADFTLFAIPQDHYQGKVYVRALPDAGSPYLTVYPLDVASGKLGPSVLNTPADAFTLSANQERVAVIDVGGTRAVSMFDLISGTLLSTWTLADDEWFDTTPKAGVYVGSGVSWVSEDCFEHTLWLGNPRLENPLVSQEIKMFCIEEASE